MAVRCGDSSPKITDREAHVPLRPAEATRFIAGASLLALAVQVTASSLSPQPCTDEAQEVTIQDDGLKQAIRRQLKLAPDAAITCKDMQGLRELSAQEANIASLAGLEHATQLERLDCARNRIKNLAPLSGLQRLTELHVERNLVADLAPLQRNTALRKGFRLFIQHNCLDLTDDAQAMKDITALLARGIEIEYEPNPVTGCSK